MKCKFCERIAGNPGGLAAHEKYCKENPNREIKIRSPDAGQQKGCVAWNKGKELARAPKWDLKYPDEVIFCENSTYARHSLRDRILGRDLIPYVCGICEMGPEWMGFPMTLILDHINGVNNDNRLFNLRFVCSNCDSQLSTYKARNKKSKGQLAESGLMRCS